MASSMEDMHGYANAESEIKFMLLKKWIDMCELQAIVGAVRRKCR